MGGKNKGLNGQLASNGNVNLTPSDDDLGENKWILFFKINFEILPNLEILFLERATFPMKHLLTPPTSNVLPFHSGFFEQNQESHLRNRDCLVPNYESGHKRN